MRGKHARQFTLIQTTRALGWHDRTPAAARSPVDHDVRAVIRRGRALALEADPAAQSNCVRPSQLAQSGTWLPARRNAGARRMEQSRLGLRGSGETASEN